MAKPLYFPVQKLDLVRTPPRSLSLQLITDIKLLTLPGNLTELVKLTHSALYFTCISPEHNRTLRLNCAWLDMIIYRLCNCLYVACVR